jgi:endonuclease YncB( thermonuclease family)
MHPFDALVVGVHDGDTITVLRDRQRIRVRLHGIDCPELGQPFGRPAKRLTSSLVFHQVVHLVPRDVDRYGRLVAVVFVGHTDVNLELVRRGLAWHYTRYSSDPQLAAAERSARAARLGLWADAHPIPPWDWRHGPPAR